MTLLSPWFQTFNLLMWERINFSCFNACPWCFVTAALGSEYSLFSSEAPLAVPSGDNNFLWEFCAGYFTWASVILCPSRSCSTPWDVDICEWYHSAPLLSPTGLVNGSLIGDLRGRWKGVGASFLLPWLCAPSLQLQLFVSWPFFSGSSSLLGSCDIVSSLNSLTLRW